MPSLGVIMSEFTDKHYLFKNYDIRAVRRRRPHDFSCISLVTIPACDRRTDGRTDGCDYGYRALRSIS